MLVFVGEEESVPLHDVLKLLADDAGKCGANNSSRHWILSHSSDVGINVLDSLVSRSHIVPGLLADLRRSVTPVCWDGQLAELSKLGVAGQTMIPGPLDVPGKQILTKSGVLCAVSTEEVIGDGICRLTVSFIRTHEHILPRLARLIRTEDKFLTLKGFKIIRLTFNISRAVV